MANIKVKDHDAAEKYLKATGVGTDGDPYIVEHEVVQGTAADLNITEASASDIKTAVELIDNAVDGNYLNTNLNIAGTDVSANAGVLTAQTQRVTIATDDEVNNFLGTIDADTSTLAGAVAAGQVQVDIVADGAGLATNAAQLADGHNVTVDNAAAGAAVNIQDGGNVITVDGTVTATPSGTQDVDVTANSIGLATSAKQLADGHNVTIDNAAAGAAVNIQDGGNTISVDGSVNLIPATSGGLSIHRSIDIDESEEEVKAAAGQIYGWYLYNLHADTIRHIKFYNDTAANVVVGTDTPILTIPLGAGMGANVSFPNGIPFSTALCIAATTGIADSDTGAPGANEVIANVFFK